MKTIAVILSIGAVTFLGMLNLTELWQEAVPTQNVSLMSVQRSGRIIAAPGLIEGTTQPSELRFEVSGRIVQLSIQRGDWVRQGALIATIDSEAYRQKTELMEARLLHAQAVKDRLMQGAKVSEIESARQEFQAALPLFQNAERLFERRMRLFKRNAISRQSLDDAQAAANSRGAAVLAAKARLETLQSPAHEGDLKTANARIQIAAADLKIAQQNVEDCVLVAPSDGVILEIQSRVGELVGPEAAVPVVTLVDNRSLYVAAEVDEYDALDIHLGQYCEVTSDAHEGVLAVGKVVQIEPGMKRKRILGRVADERLDAYNRIVKISLPPEVKLPIGFPVEVAIHESKEASESQSNMAMRPSETGQLN